jgi:hypothetical protein
MTIPPAPAPDSRIRLQRFVAAAALTIVIAGVAIDHVTLSHLVQKTESAAQRSEIGALQGRLSTVDEQLAAIKREPTAASQANLSAARQALDERLDSVEQALGATARADDLVPLKTHLHQIDTRLGNVESARHKPSTRPTGASRAQSAQPNTLEPPFVLFGTELRGGEAFLSIAPSGAQSLAQVRLLHPGERQGDWRLEALEGQTATFRVDGQVRQITVR